MRKLAFWLTIGFIFTVPWEAAIHISAIGRVSRAFGLIAATVWALSVVLRGRLDDSPRTRVRRSLAGA